MAHAEAPISIQAWQEQYQSDPDAWRTTLERRRVAIADCSRTAWDAAIPRWHVPPHYEPTTNAPLAGVPMAVKDLFDVQGWVTAAGSKLVPELGRTEQLGQPAEADSFAVRALREAGAVPVARTAMNEFAYGLDGKNPHFGDVTHPQSADRISGGSSSGSAWAVGAGVVPVALGTDTGGSVRVPAALCGIWGFRRAVDRWAAEGVFPLARSFDTAGWFAASGADMARMLELFAAEHAAVGADGRGIERILWYRTSKVGYAPGVDGAYLRFVRDAAWEVYGLDDADRTTAAGRLVHELESLSDAGLNAYNVIGSTEAYEVHRAWFDTHRHLYNPAVWALIDRGRKWPTGQLEAARAVERRFVELIAEVLDYFDAIVLPAVPTYAPRHDEVDGVYRTDTLRLSVPGSLSHVPALSVPLIVDTAGETAGAASRGGTVSERFRPTVGVQVLVSPNGGRDLVGLARRLEPAAAAPVVR